MSDTNVERYEVDEQPDEVHDPELLLMEAEARDETRGELLKFGIVAGALLLTVLVIGLLQPVIFNRIVPAVLGEDQLNATIINTEAEGESLKPEAEEMETEAASPNESESVEDAEASASEGESGAEEAASEPDPAADDEPVNPEDFPTAVPPTKTHTIQPGETLTAIARQYGVTVQALVEANQISNPNRVDAGTVLTIPAGQ